MFKALLPALLPALLITACSIALSTQLPRGFLGNDSREYLEFSESLLNGSFFLSIPPSERLPGESIRSPGFPVILALGRFGGALSVESGLLVAHSILLLLSLILLFRELARFAPLLVSFPLVLGTVLLNLEYFASLVSEWTAFCLIMIVFACLLRFSSLRSPSALCGLSVACGMLVLTREALLGALFLPFLALVQEKIFTKSCMVRASYGVLMLLCWMLFNSYRIGSFTLSQKTGFALFNVGSYLGPVPLPQEPASELATFIEFMNSSQSIASDEELKEAYLVPSPRLEQKAGENYTAAVQFAEQRSISRKDLDDYMKKYSFLAIQSHFDRYLLFLWYCLGCFAYSLPLFLFFTIVATPWGNALPSPLKKLATAALFMHIFHLCLILLTQTISLRYYTLTAYPAYLIVFLCWGAWFMRGFLKEHYENRT